MAKILFIQNTRWELLGIKSIASYIEPKHQAELIFGSTDDILNRCKTFRPDVVGISVFSIDHHWALDIARRIKLFDNNILVLLGGVHPTHYTDILAEDPIDAICIGEGEKPVLDLLDAIESKASYEKIPSLWIKKSGSIFKNSLNTPLKADEIPIINTKIYAAFPHIVKERSAIFLCSRGCPFSCFYCGNYGYNKLYKNHYFRIRKIEAIIEEIKNVVHERNISSIKFQDDIFGVDEVWLEEFLREYKEKIGLPFYCLLRVEYIKERILKMLKKAGCFQVGIGIESGEEFIRNSVLGRRMSTDLIWHAVKLLKKHKISFHTFNMFGLPSEDYKSALKTLSLNLAIKPDVAWSAIFQPYPGTKFFCDDVKKTMSDTGFNRFEVIFKYSKDFKKIQRLQKLFMLIIKWPVTKYLLPVLVRLPLDVLYDKISKFCWHYFYHKRIRKNA